MRILIVNQHVSNVLGGSEVQCDLIARHLQSSGHDVLYGIANGKAGDYDVSYRWHEFGRPFAVSFLRVLKRFQPDVVYWRYNKHHLLAATLIAAMLRTRFVFSVCAFSDTKRWVWTGRSIFPRLAEARAASSLTGWAKALVDLQWPIRSALNFLGYRWVDAAVVNNADFLDRLPISRQITIHNSAAATSEPFAWPRPYVVWVSSIKPKKNPGSYIELASELADLGVDFLMAGSIQDQCYAFIGDADHLLPNLHYLGEKPPQLVNGILRSALFLVHTSDPEGFSGNLIQAWSQGKPTISLYHDPEGMISGHEAGRLSGDMSNLVRDVKHLIENETLRREMGDRAAQLARRHFDTESNVAKLEQFLGTVVDPSTGSRRRDRLRLRD